ncbi:MAG: hypothetical protein DI563_18845 [Variovorax paradoxus]|uniref:HTH gntR-type domain-containing protein n=1 Tax=Variovorax paradoxus TaxID=34073 RepID=A0A2W5PX85_VARPD|nr:MAG: hypothetical protein DI563_18845 [Variovorax paradoxus]
MPARQVGLRMADLPQSLHARLRDALRADILEGRLRPGDKLASESEMQAEHGVSRITVRQALAALQADGLIVKLHGKGAGRSRQRRPWPHSCSCAPGSRSTSCRPCATSTASRSRSTPPGCARRWARSWAAWTSRAAT